jgi:hypothetical protein
MWRAAWACGALLWRLAPSGALWASSGTYRSPIIFYGIWRIFSVETKNMQKIETSTGTELEG